MPIFLDMHTLNNFTPEQLEAGLEKNADEFGVIVHQMLFNENEDILHCICEGPNIESIKKHHDKFNTTCDKIIEIDQIKTDKIIKEEKLKTIGEITSKVSHDIRSPLSIIQTSMEMIKSTHPELYNVEKKRFERIFKAINQIEFQSRDVLSFLRERTLTYSDNTISDILNTAIDRIEIPMDVIIQKPKEDLEIICDFESLCTIFTNLIINAIQAVKNIGEITIKVNSDMDNISNYHIKVNKFFKGDHNAELIFTQKHLYVYPFEVEDNGLFYLKFDNNTGYDLQPYSIKTFDNCNARSLIEIIPVLPNDDILVRGFMGMGWEFKDQCVANYFTFDPDFWNYRIIKSPLRQHADHDLPIHMQRCVSDEHVSIFSKSNSNHIVCVKPSTSEKLIERGWTS